MPVTVLDTCKKIMEGLKSEGLINESRMYQAALEKFIMRYAGADPRTVISYIKYLEDFGFFRREGEVFIPDFNKPEGKGK